MSAPNAVKHTPGPWKIYDTGEGFRPFAVYAGSRCIADVNAQDESVVVPEERANADLVAAAPDLLAALGELLERCHESRLDSDPRVRAALGTFVAAGGVL